MESHRNYTSEEVSEAIKHDGTRLQRLLKNIMEDVTNDAHFKNNIAQEIIRKRGTQEDFEDVFQESLATYIVKLSNKEIRLLPGELIPYYAAKECLRYLDSLENDRLTGTVFERSIKLDENTVVALGPKPKPKPKSRLSGKFWSTIDLKYSSEEILPLIQGKKVDRDSVIDDILKQLHESEDFLAKIETYVFRLDETLLEKEETEVEKELKKEIINQGLKSFIRKLSKVNCAYEFQFEKLQRGYIATACKYKWFNELKKIGKYSPEPEEDLIGSEILVFIDSNPSAQDEMEQQERFQFIMEAIEQQENGCNEYLLMLAQKFSMEAIAEKMEVTIAAAKNKASRCRKKLRAYLKAKGY